MRGEHYHHTVGQLAAPGSSPHARGAPESRRDGSAEAGIIPACAGSTVVAKSRTRGTGDHPRMRGEHFYWDGECWRLMGSSPHARGAPARDRRRRDRDGIIPACTGSTARVPRGGARRRDHPRMRGEHAIDGFLARSGKGSSPHARGALWRIFGSAVHKGIIPACAGSTSWRTARESGGWDHPRMRGEHSDPDSLIAVSKGSSPHARGARRRIGSRRDRHGIIPACAGSTPRREIRLRRKGDHPRMRGEHMSSFARRPSFSGSSPHARGARRAGRRELPAQRIIPACAGSTRASREWPRPPRDHPRMRGEHSSYYGCEYDWAGSSPHARGAPTGRSGRSMATGIIPACAGSTAHLNKHTCLVGDHPRMRGEHARFQFSVMLSRGSSPHARGAPDTCDARYLEWGIIPACAGSTLLESCRTGARGDHPRMRGEHHRGQTATHGSTGSSPHARGAPDLVTVVDLLNGIIPACAGSTSWASVRPSRSGDHPRMRGEHEPYGGPLIDQTGSSPHARGAHKDRLPIPRTWGIIPACAGSTWRRRVPSPTAWDHPRMRGEHDARCRVPENLRGSSPHARGARATIPVWSWAIGIIPACAGSTP